MMSFSIEVDKEVYENYFRIADSNGDGKINGPEAVAFFQGSNLPNEVLSQIWNHADRDRRGFLDSLGFYNALKLVSIAQLRGYLTRESVQHALLATSKIPAPQINMANSTRNYKDSKKEDVVNWPKFLQSDITKYAEIFMIMDKDRDGKISGEQARTLFLSWKIPKRILREIWTLSDCDKDGSLSFVEFCIAVYFIERHREGLSLPTALPDTVQYDGTLLKAASKDVEDGDLQKAIKASIQTAIQERLSVLQPCNSFGSTDMQSPGPSTPIVDAPGLHEFGANHIPTINSNLVPSAPRLNSFSTECFFSEHHVSNNDAIRLKSSEFEEQGTSNVNLGMCSICIEDPVEGACIPCGHMAGCMGCLKKIKETGGECPICRAKIVWIVKLYSV